MKNILHFLTLLCICGLNAQIQISNFTYNSIGYAEPTGLRIFNNKIFFSAADDGFGRELWSSDGTSSNTNLVKDINPGEANGLYIFYSAVLNDNLFFVANDSNQYNGIGEIWKTNGTLLGTTLVTSFNGRIYGLTTVGDHIFYSIKTEENSLQIWKTDGTLTGTQLVKNIESTSSYLSFQGNINDKFIFTLRSGSSNNVKVWRSDGTDLGTYPITDEIDGNGSEGGTLQLSQYIVYNNNLYFVSRYHLYKTDGTTADIVTTLWNAQNNLVDFSDVIELDNNLYFSFFSKNLKKLSIYKSDGTSIGTSEIYSSTSTQYFYPSYLNTLGNNLIFSSINSNNGTSLFYLNSITNLTTEIVEIDQLSQAPVVFIGSYSALSIDNINDNLFFVSSPKNTWPLKKGWILDITSSILNPIAALDNLSHTNGLKIVYNNDFYYSKDYQLWKLDINNLNLISFNDGEEIQFYPNPALDYIYFNNSDDISQIEIYDMMGKLVFKDHLITNNTLHIESLKQGNYIIKILTRNGIITRKLLKK